MVETPNRYNNNSLLIIPISSKYFGRWSRPSWIWAGSMPETFWADWNY